MREDCLRTVRWVVSALMVASLLATLPGCGSGNDNMGQVGFIILSPGEVASAGDGIRGLDRTKDKYAELEVLRSPDDKDGLFRQTVEVLPVDPGKTQDVSSSLIPAGKGYFARIRGLDATQAIVNECAISGPFDLQGGNKLSILMYLNTPPIGDANCDTICTDSSQCPSGNNIYCGSNYPSCDQTTQKDNKNPCVKAQCLTNPVGNACTVSAGCGSASFTCQTFPDGYCSKSCSSGDPCPPSTFCADKTYTGAPQSMCIKNCTSDADCRTPKYSCKPISADVPPKTGCLPT